MKLIDILNKIASEEKLPSKILIKDKVYYLINDIDENIVYSQTINERNWESFIDHRLNITRCLNEDVIILENEQIEDEEIDIQELEEIMTLEKWKEQEVKDEIQYFDYIVKHINKNMQVIMQIYKKLKEKE